MPAVEIQQVSHRYGTHEALQQVSLTIEEGAFFGLLGPNGGGKTTLFRILSTLLSPTEGRAWVQGHDVTQKPHAIRQCLGVIFQQPALDADLTVRENLRFHGALYGLSGTQLRTRIEMLLDTFDVANRANDRVKTLSGGLQRRADLARGLLHQPDVLLLDEPTTGLDPVARRAFWQALARLRRDEGTTMIVATHLMEEAEACDTIGILDRGHLVVHGAPGTLTEALGDETLWLETEDAPTLRDQLRDQLGLEATIIGNALQLTHPDAPTLLGKVYDTFGASIDSAMVRKPTLEDVFMVHTGHAFSEHDAPQVEVA